MKINAATKQTGYSLLELLGVLAILGIVVAIAVPNLSKANRAYQLQATAQQIAQLFQSAKQDAIGRNTARKVTFNTNDQSFTSSNGTQVVLPPTIRFEAIPSAIAAPAMLQVAALNSGILAHQSGDAKCAIAIPQTATAGIYEMWFSAKGLPVAEPGVVHWVCLANQDGERVVIALSSSGSVSLLTHRNGDWK